MFPQVGLCGLFVRTHSMLVREMSLATYNTLFFLTDKTIQSQKGEAVRLIKQNVKQDRSLQQMKLKPFVEFFFF